MQENWTESDEQILLAMQSRKKRVYEANVAPLRAFIAEQCFEGSAEHVILEDMIKHAKELRSLLKPFDDGVRAAEAKLRCDVSGPAGWCQLHKDHSGPHDFV